MIAYLGTIYMQLKALSETYIETSFLWGISTISKTYLDILNNSNIVKSFNYYFLENLKQDIDELQSYFDDIANSHSGRILMIYYIYNINC